MSARGLVTVSLLCYNSMTYLPKVLEAIKRQTYPLVDLIITDNSSSDGTAEYLTNNCSGAQLILNSTNTGFCRGHNQAIGRSKGEYVLILNHDVLLQPTYIEELVKAAERDSLAGILSGKLLRTDSLFNAHVVSDPTIDSTGLVWRPNGRFFDRGAGLADLGQYDECSYMFGVCGAAMLLRRAMLEEIVFESQYFDEDFYFGNEDADLCWRSQIAGWKVIYTPIAIAYHVRFIRPGSYAEMPRWQRIHSLKNRFMLRIKNMSLRQFVIQALPLLSWDIVVLGYTLLRQPYAIEGLWRLWKLMPRNLRKRRSINRSRRVSDRYLRQWFSWKDVAKPTLLTESHSLRWTSERGD